MRVGTAGLTDRAGFHPAHLYAYLEAARARLLQWVGGLTDEQYAREFPFGHRSIRATLVHTASAEWTYGRRLRGEVVPPPEERPFARFARTGVQPLAAAWAELAAQTRQTLAAITDWTAPVEYAGLDGVRIRTTTGGIAAQLLFHEVHHRAQVMAMLRQCGVSAQNLDYSILMFERLPSSEG
ncbi:MAG: DinB family protein [Armatimonadota bacterium]|nr:DinB family protein [Armatimonadota bacterium]MDR7400704.1 DinB family protein [Armatimonadota bacterium]MDR7403637.1 DinB family protein [Armatimonadota bacterium]MDR7436485.1 DinB family protein [Armatimonadota bacterium]MDR7472520.1 DinB family protein [Armatimonadota bacterium]